MVVCRQGSTVGNSGRLSTREYSREDWSSVDKGVQWGRVVICRHGITVGNSGRPSTRDYSREEWSSADKGVQ